MNTGGIAMARGPILRTIMGSKDRHKEQLAEYEDLVTRAREGRDPSTRSCIRVSIAFHRELFNSMDELFRVTSPMEQAVVDGLIYKYVEDVAYVAENISPTAAKRLLSYVKDIRFKRELAGERAAISMGFGYDRSSMIGHYAVT